MLADVSRGDKGVVLDGASTSHTIWTKAIERDKRLMRDDVFARNAISHKLNRVSDTVRADDEGLIFTVNGKINYVVAPVGIDIDKYADEGGHAPNRVQRTMP